MTTGKELMLAIPSLDARNRDYDPGISRRMARLVVLALAAFMLAGCNVLGFKSWDWHQKLTVEIATPNGPVGGSSVVQVHREETPQWFLGGGQGHDISGEATIVEVAPGKYLFALLSGSDGSGGYHAYLPYKLFSGPDGEDYADALNRIEKTRASRNVPGHMYPLLVTFDDINVPASVREVKPDDLAAVFGPGYELTSMTLEITDAPVTKGRVEKLLGWLAEYRANGFRLNGKRSFAYPDDGTFAESIGTGDFKIGK